MTRPLMSFIKKLGIDAIQLAHAERQVSLRRFNKQMIVVVHETVGVADPMIALINVAEHPEEGFTVAVVLEDVLLLISP